MSILIYGGGGITTELKTSTVTIEKPDNDEYAFRIYYTTVQGGALLGQSSTMQRTTRRVTLNIAHNPRFTIFCTTNNEPSLTCLGDVEVLYNSGEPPVWALETIGDGSIIFT